MFRQIIYTGEQLRGYDFAQAETHAMIAICNAVQAMLGQNTAVAWGMTASGTGANLVVSLTRGGIFEVAPIDATTAGLLVQNTNPILQQGAIEASTVTLSTSGISGGQSRYTLIQAQFNQSDGIPASDPTSGNLPFYNSANPSSPIFASANTQRQGIVTIGLKNGTAAATGTEVPPNPDTGWVPLYLIDLAFGQTTVSTGQILTAGPSVGINVPSNYQYAPFLSGLLNSHHSGNAGQAPKINLALEVQGILGIANLPAASVGDNFAGINIQTGAYTTVAADYGKLLIYSIAASGTAVVNLLNGTADGQSIWLLNNSGFIWTVGSASSLSFSGSGTSGTSFIIPPGGGARVVWSSSGGGGFSVPYFSAAFAGSSSVGNLASSPIYPSNHTVLTSEFGSCITLAAAAPSPATFSIPNGLIPGNKLYLFNVSGQVLTIAQAGGATGLFDGCGLFNATSFNINPSGAAIIEWSGANWFVPYYSGYFSNRIQLQANLNVYVNGSVGSDSNNGLSAGNPFATMQHAWNYLLNNYDLNGFSAAIIQSGTNTDTLNANGIIVGATAAQSLRITVNGTWSVTNGSCIISNGASFLVNGSGTLSASGTGIGQGYAIVAFTGSQIIFNGISFGACGVAHIGASTNSSVSSNGSYTVNGSAPIHMSAAFSASVSIVNSITFSGSIAFGTTGVAGFLSLSDCASANMGSLTFTGTPTGRRYYSANGASINTSGGGATFLPGNAAGALVNGGLYS